MLRRRCYNGHWEDVRRRPCGASADDVDVGRWQKRGSFGRRVCACVCRSPGAFLGATTSTETSSVLSDVRMRVILARLATVYTVNLKTNCTQITSIFIIHYSFVTVSRLGLDFTE